MKMFELYSSDAVSLLMSRETKDIFWRVIQWFLIDVEHDVRYDAGPGLGYDVGWRRTLRPGIMASAEEQIGKTSLPPIAYS
jgi:hypothetical protein